MNEALLTTRGLRKSFGSKEVLAGLNLTVRRGAPSDSTRPAPLCCRKISANPALLKGLRSSFTLPVEPVNSLPRFRGSMFFPPGASHRIAPPASGEERDWTRDVC